MVWEKEWWSINAGKYCEYTVPSIDGYLRYYKQNNREGQELSLMQDGALGHNSSRTTIELEEGGNAPIYWPAFSPDLNPIEMVWRWLKVKFRNTMAMIQSFPMINYAELYAKRGRRCLQSS